MPIYFDHAATTPMSEPAISALVKQVGLVGNASSLHSLGRNVRKSVEEAREKLAKLVGAAPSEIIFTGSGTEANNLLVKGLFWTRKHNDVKRNVILVAAFEHHAILDPVDWLAEHQSAEVIYLPITPNGFLDLDFLRGIVAHRADEIAFIAVMHSNNEIGTIQPIADIVAIANDIPVHSDAVQSFGKTEFNFSQLGLTSATVSAHKIGGPLGVAALILKRGMDITPILHGGGQERDIRSGTLNAPGIVAFAAAAEDACKKKHDRDVSVHELKKYLISELRKVVPDIQVNGALTPTLPGIVNVQFPGTENDSLLLLLDAEGIYCSTGSACSAGVARPSHVLLAMDLDEATAQSSLRFSLGPDNTATEVNQLVSVIGPVVERARAVRGNRSPAKADSR